MAAFDEVPTILPELNERLKAIHASLDIPSKNEELAQLEKRMAQPGFWDNPQAAQETVGQLKTVKALLDPLESALADTEELSLLWELAQQENDEDTKRDVAESLEKLSQRVEQVELASLLGGPHDARDCFFSLHAGAGGTESCDWANMLLRMYTRYFDTMGYGYEEVDLTAGEEAGIRSVTLRVHGPYAYGYLSCEMGVHRLVRISPFDANKRRHTSFAAVDVLPDMGEASEVEIAAKDIEMELYCKASGAGGQNVNKVATAVRI